MTDISDPKLKAVRAEIEALLKKHDVAGVCVLHNAPNSSESFAFLEPSYSQITGVAPHFRFRAKADDYAGDLERMARDVNATANMTSSIALGLGIAGLHYLELATAVDKITGAKHSGPTFQPDAPKGAG